MRMVRKKHHYHKEPLQSNSSIYIIWQSLTNQVILTIERRLKRFRRCTNMVKFLASTKFSGSYFQTRTTLNTTATATISQSKETIEGYVGQYIDNISIMPIQALFFYNLNSQAGRSQGAHCSWIEQGPGNILRKAMWMKHFWTFSIPFISETN